VVVTALLKGAKGNYSVPGGQVMVRGFGKASTFPATFTGAVTNFQATDAGGVVSTSGASLAVDFSGASGADAVIVAVIVLAGDIKGGKSSPGTTFVTAGDRSFVVMTLQKGAPPEVKAEADKVVVGKQTFSYDGKNVAAGR